MSEDNVQEWTGLERTKHRQRMRKSMTQPRPDGVFLKVKRKQADVRTKNRRKRREQDERQNEEYPQSKLEDYNNDGETEDTEIS